MPCTGSIARHPLHNLDTRRPTRTVTHLQRLNSVPTNANRRKSRCALTTTFSHCHLCHSLLRGGHLTFDLRYR